MSVTYVNAILVVVIATGTTIVKSSIILQDSAKNVGTLDMINHLINKLINQSAFMLAASTPTTPSVVEETTSSLSITEMVANTTQASEEQKGISGFRSRETTIEDITDTAIESRNQEEESAEESQSVDDLHDDTSFDVSRSYDFPGFYLSMKTGGRNPFILNDHVLEMHLNQTIERLREFNDKYERLMTDNEAINENLLELKNYFTPRYQDKGGVTNGTTAVVEDETDTTVINATLPSQSHENMINGIRANLLV